jgi:hypothetical protein
MVAIQYSSIAAQQMWFYAVAGGKGVRDFYALSLTTIPHGD